MAVDQEVDVELLPLPHQLGSGYTRLPPLPWNSELDIRLFIQTGAIFRAIQIDALYYRIRLNPTLVQRSFRQLNSLDLAYCQSV